LLSAEDEAAEVDDAATLMGGVLAALDPGVELSLRAGAIGIGDGDGEALAGAIDRVDAGRG